MKNTTAIILLFIANSISGVAQGISMLAIPWYFAREGLMADFALVYMFTNIISLFWIPYSGTMIDRHDRRKIFLVLTTICGSLILSIGLLGYFQQALSWYFVAAIFVLTFLNYAVHYPNLYSFVQEITEKAHYGKITSYLEIQGQLTSILAGAGAAFLLEGTTSGQVDFLGMVWEWPFEVAAWEIYEIFILDASTYFVSFMIIFFIRYQPLKERIPEKGTVWNQLMIGYHYLKDNPWIFVFGVASYAVFVVVLLEGFFLGALYANEHLQSGANVYAISEIFYASGAVFAGLAIRRLFKKINAPGSIIIMTLATGILFFVLASSKSVFLFYAMLLLLGITNAGTRIQRTTYLFSNIPNQVFGRSSSIFNLTNILFRIFFLAIFSFPFFQSGIAVTYPFYMLSAFLLLSVWVLIRFRNHFP